MIPPSHVVSTPLHVTHLDNALILPWYALRVRNNAERRVLAALDTRGYMSYVPLYQKTSNWSDRVKVMDQVLFPGYVFCRFDASRRIAITGLPGVVNIVRFGSYVIPVPDEEIDAVRRLISSGLPATPWPFLKTGDRVRVVRGALTGVEGILEHIKKEYRIVISVTLLQRSVAAEIDRDSVEPIQSNRRPC